MKTFSVLLLACGNLLAADPVALSLKDFTSLSGGEPAAGWADKEGMIELTGKGAGNIISREEYSNFELEWEWKLTEGGNNGIKYWVTKIGDKEWLGIEYQMIDDLKHPDGLKGGSHTTGSIYDLKGPAADKVLKPIGEWNQSRVVVQDGVLKHYLNGKLTSTVDTRSEEWKECLAQSKFKGKEGFAPGRGRLMLTEHGDPAWFRNLRIKAL